jgi:hypothetical protein
MSAKLWIAVIASSLLLGAASLGPSATRPVAAVSPAPLQVAPAAAPAAPVQQVTPNGVYMWNYSVKFVCGRQTALDPSGQIIAGEPPVKPGNYATEINIHNYSYREFKLRKKLLVLVDKSGVIGREPDVVRPDPERFASVVLTPDSATLDDCNALWKMAGENLVAAGPPLTIGYLVLLSPVDLDVDAVYTAEVGESVAGATFERPTGISIDVERVPGKRVFVPAGFLNQFP